MHEQERANWQKMKIQLANCNQQHCAVGLSRVFFFFKQKTAYEIMPSLVGSEMCIRDRPYTISTIASAPIVPGLHAIMTALDFSDILRRSNGLPAITTVTILLVRSAIFSNNTCCSSGKVRNACLLYTSPSPRD